MLLHTPPEGYVATCAALREMDQRETVARVSVRTLVIAGAQDAVTTPADAHFLTDRITARNTLELNAAHLSNIEDADAFTSGAHELSHLSKEAIVMDDRERHSAGMKVRRAVLGDAHVDRAESTKNAFSEPFQDLITRYAWGEIWSRPGLATAHAQPSDAFHDDRAES